MGEVYEVQDQALNLPIALKTVKPELLSEPDALDRFKRELLVARRVSHENVCRVYDFIEHHRPGQQPTPCLTMELLEGETLAQILTRQRPFSCEEALPLLRQIALGLTVLHEHGIVHRDLKPSNIMIVPRPGRAPRVAVTDFGLAKASATETGWFQSAAEFRGGAPYFMAPELLRKMPPGVSSDVYSFGLLMDEMVTTSRAFSSTSPQALYWEKLWQTPVPPADRSLNLPPAWARAIMRCIEPEPAARCASIAEVLDLIDAPAPGPVPEAGPPAPQVFKRRVILGSLIAVPLASATAVTALALQPVSTSIEVYNIHNATGSGEYEYLCRGTTAELTRQLLQMERLRVYSPGAPQTATRREVPGRFALTGMLQAHSGQIRLSVQLADNEHDGAVVWSDNFDRDGIGDPLALQSDIARNVVSVVEKRVLLGATPASAGLMANAVYRVRNFLAYQGSSALPGPPTTSNVAFDFYMRGHHLLEEFSPDTVGSAIDYFKRAIESDPRFALAYASAADAYLALMNFNYAPHPELERNARQFAERAVALDPNLSEAHTALATVRQTNWDHAGAEKSYREAMRLKPNSARALRRYAGFVLEFGRFDEALRENRRALEMDPYDTSAYPAAGLYLFFSGHCLEAAGFLRSALVKKESIGVRSNLSQVYAWLAKISSGATAGQYFKWSLEQAKAVAEAGLTSAPAGKTSYSDQLFAIAYALRGWQGETQQYLQRLEVDMRSGGTSPVTVAWIYAILGRRDIACDLLETAATWRDRRLLYTKIVPFLNNLRGYPRFEALLATMNLT